jgi:hypothetical protein
MTTILVKKHQSNDLTDVDGKETTNKPNTQFGERKLVPRLRRFFFQKQQLRELQIIICPFFYLPLYCLSFDLLLLITPLVSSNFSRRNL